MIVCDQNIDKEQRSSLIGFHSYSVCDYSHFNSPPTQHRSPVLSPVSQDSMLHSTQFTINQDKTPSNHQYSFSIRIFILPKNVPGVENVSRNVECNISYRTKECRNVECTVSCKWGKIDLLQ